MSYTRQTIGRFSLADPRLTLRRATARAALVLAALALCLAIAPTDSDAADENGWGFGIADNVHPNFGIPAVETYFKQMNPKIYRVQVPYDILSSADPTAPERVADIKVQIARARQHGVQHVLLTFSMGYADYQVANRFPIAETPSPDAYEADIRRVIAEFDSLVDAWSPANEPNAGWRWFGDAHHPTKGPTLLAAYFNKLRLAVPEGDELVSPEFHDRVDGAGTPTNDGLHTGDSRSSVSHFIEHYLAAGGGWGQHAAFHPYGAVRSGNPAAIEDFLELVPPEVDVWFTEIGAKPDFTARGAKDEATQTRRVRKLVDYLKVTPRVSRAYFYNLWDDTSTWDSALIRHDGTPRPSWSVWCGAARSDDPGICVRAPVQQTFTADFDGDGVDDLGTRNPATGRIVIRRGPTFAFSTETSLTWAFGAHLQPFTGDFNNDGFTDIALRDANSGNVHRRAGPNFSAESR